MHSKLYFNGLTILPPLANPNQQFHLHLQHPRLGRHIILSVFHSFCILYLTSCKDNKYIFTYADVSKTGTMKTLARITTMRPGPVSSGE